ncbi:hypothetical protein T4C_9144 [Trichinella pseudospiralis]|uniref:Uncharacterized protein n=1 Tax=Trichinella pseudospiralis TaxID=6337 RepID=A0A0V1K5N6_TRIPS|nr:hypothetical protein T4C_9144 [Trichinella pseudospiralis]
MFSIDYHFGVFDAKENDLLNVLLKISRNNWGILSTKMFILFTREHYGWFFFKQPLWLFPLSSATEGKFKLTKRWCNQFQLDSDERFLTTLWNKNVENCFGATIEKIEL